MSVCAACGAENREGRKFCTACGTRLATLACPECGSAIEAGARFCGECGRPLTLAAPGVASRPSRPAGLHREAPGSAGAATSSSAGAARSTGSRIEGERKQLTVLFADVQGSMDLQESLDSEEWALVMDRFVRLLAEGVRRFEGTVDKFTGDGIMALFGAPVALEDHARRACLAALHLTRSIAGYADELRRTRGMEFQVRIGLNSGEAVVGGVGEDVRLDPTALGHTVGLAQRMEAIAEPGRVYLTERTARLVEGAFRLVDMGPVAVKGVREPVHVFALEGMGRAPRATRAATPMVGRAAELAALEDALARASQGVAQVVGVVGEAGSGKSRLCEEFVASVEARGVTVRRTTGVSHGRGVPLLPILAFLRDYFGITEVDNPAEVRQKVGDYMLALDASFAGDLPLLFDFMEAPDPGRPALELAPDVRMRRIFDVLRRLTARRSEREVLVVLMEDLHWFDPQSEAFLERIVEWIPGSRTLILVNFRPEFSAPWMRHSYYRQLYLAPLHDEFVGELLGGMLGIDLSLAPLVGYVSERTAGNPFFIEEVVRDLLEDGTLAGRPGAYRLSRPLHEIRVPASVHAVLAARIDRLPGPHKTLLQTAAVIGRTFSERVLARVVNLDPETLDDMLHALCAAELLQETRRHPTTEYRFWHPLTQEVAYRTLLAGRRKRLHGEVAEALAERDADRLDETAAVLAWHWEQAERPLEAAHWNARAAGFALRSDLGEALRRWQLASDLLEQAEESPESLTLSVRCRTLMLRFRARMGMAPEEEQRLFEEALERAERLGDLGLHGLVYVASGSAALWRGDVVEAHARYAEAARLGDETSDPDLRAALWVAPPFVLAYLGPLSEALAGSDRVLAACGGDAGRGLPILGYGVLARSLQIRGSILAFMGRLGEGAGLVDRAIALARQRFEAESLGWALPVLARITWLTGEPVDLAPATEAVRLAEETGNVSSLVLGLEALALADLSAGRPVEAVAACERALEQSRRHRSGLFQEAYVLGVLARARLASDDPAGAAVAADEAVAIACARQIRVAESLMTLTRAQVRRAAGGPGAAVAADLRAALGLARASGALSHEPFIREELGRLESDGAELAEALRLFGAIGATGHVRRLEAELLGSPGPAPS